MAIKLIDNTARFHIISQYDASVVNETKEEVEVLKEKGETTRFEKYMDSLNAEDLKFAEGSEQPTLFVVRCLTNEESTILNEKHMIVNVENKRAEFKNYMKYLQDCFDLAVLGISREDGSTMKVTSKDVQLHHVSSIGSTVAYLTSVGKNLKNV